MHLTRALQDWDLRAEREETALHQFGEDCLEYLHDTAFLSLLDGVEVNSKGNLAHKVQGEENVEKREVNDLAA